MRKIKDLGRKRSNPDANLASNFRLESCGAANPCLDYYEAVIPATETVQSVTIDGVVTALPTPVLITNVASIRDQIATLLASGTNEEYDIHVRCFHGPLNGTANTFSFAHIGTRTISAITTNIGAKVVQRQCSSASFSDFELTLAGSIPTIGNGTTNVALTTGTYAYTTNPATNATNAATLRTDIITALGTLAVAYRQVNVTVNTFASAYNIEIKRQRDNTVLYAGNSKFKEVNFYETFLNYPLNLL